MAAPSGHQPRGSDDLGVFDDAKSYYTEERHMNRAGPRTRTYSQSIQPWKVFHCKRTLMETCKLQSKIMAPKLFLYVPPLRLATIASTSAGLTC
ncbi:hypothetical protein LB505_006576 [Fusarium chuoi]|nr:hypothetical protein LB505_006576 [Fusarium chuoi]